MTAVTATFALTPARAGRHPEMHMIRSRLVFERRMLAVPRNCFRINMPGRFVGYLNTVFPELFGTLQWPASAGLFFATPPTAVRSFRKIVLKTTRTHHHLKVARSKGHDKGSLGSEASGPDPGP